MGVPSKFEAPGFPEPPHPKKAPPRTEPSIKKKANRQLLNEFKTRQSVLIIFFKVAAF
jgi:hypothetical protein